MYSKHPKWHSISRIIDKTIPSKMEKKVSSLISTLHFPAPSVEKI